MEALYAEVNQRAEAGTSRYSETGDFLKDICSVPLGKNYQMIRSRCLVLEYSFRYFLTILIMVTEQINWTKVLCGCFCFIWLWLLIAIMKRCTERYALQLYLTSLTILLNVYAPQQAPHWLRFISISWGPLWSVEVC